MYLAHQAEGVWDVSSLRCLVETPRVIVGGRYDFLLFDIDLTGVNSLELLEEVCSVQGHAPVFILSRECCLSFLKETMFIGARDYFTIPFDFRRVRDRIDCLLADVYDGFDERGGIYSGSCGEAGVSGAVTLSGKLANSFIGLSKRSLQLRADIAAVCAYPEPVLITGETGTGKDIVAHIIHENSLVSKGPYKAENVSCIPPSLADSLLFGTVRGCYTDAVDSVGLIEAANGGTLFLDEIGMLDRALQPKLLRVLEDETVIRVGSTVGRAVSFRLICATNCDLGSLVSTGGFRKDLFYRIDVLRIAIPPLRERPEDIPLLASYRLAGCRKRLSSQALDKMYRYPWPGNVRQLFSCLSRAVRSSRTEVIYPDQIRF